MYEQVNVVGLYTFMTFCLDLMHTVICPNLPQPVNGAVMYSSSTIPRPEESTVTYSCNTGYGLVGNSVRMCTSSGWSGTNPLCRGTGSLHSM